jgi:TfoX/Sxy family transcriptional regulator of competence genes
MVVSRQYVQLPCEQLEPFGRLTARRIFGKMAVYAPDLC